jgi:hypothetical protein
VDNLAASDQIWMPARLLTGAEVTHHPDLAAAKLRRATSTSARTASTGCSRPTTVPPPRRAGSWPGRRPTPVKGRLDRKPHRCAARSLLRDRAPPVRRPSSPPRSTRRSRSSSALPLGSDCSPVECRAADAMHSRPTRPQQQPRPPRPDLPATSLRRHTTGAAPHSRAPGRTRDT